MNWWRPPWPGKYERRAFLLLLVLSIFGIIIYLAWPWLKL